MANLTRPTFDQRLANSPFLAASELLHQQFWCWGKDVENGSGNLLVEYGLTRTAPPTGSNAVSLYRMEPSETSRVILRGFGIFFGDDQLGGLFLRRGSFEPLLTPFPDFERPVWLVDDLPRLRPPRQEELSKCHQLLDATIRWIADYERWVHSRLGASYRNRMLVAWRRSKHRAVSASMIVTSWLQVQELFAQQTNELIPVERPDRRHSSRRRAV